MDKCGIYKITNLKNGYIYIGQSIHIHQRWRAHRTIMNYTTSPEYNYPLYCAMRKYGLESFSFEIEEECDASQLNELETFYIKKYNSYEKGYNQTLGGDQPPSNGVGTCQWDLNGNLIKKWPSGNAAAVALGVCRNSIYEVIRGKRPTCCNCFWTRDDGTVPPINLKRTVRPIRQYDLQGNFIAEYENAVIAAQTVFNDSSKGIEIRNACNKKVQVAYGFQWRDAHDEPPGKVLPKKNKPVIQYDLEGNVIREWSSVNEIAQSLKYSASSIRSVCCGERKTSHGFKWKYKE